MDTTALADDAALRRAALALSKHRQTIADAETRRDAAVAAARDEEAKATAKAREAAAKLETDIEAYCLAHRARLFADAKSFKVGSLSFEIRKARPSVVVTGDEQDVIAAIREAKFYGFVRIGAESLDRAAILKHREQIEAANIPGLGFREGETFTIRTA